MNPLIKEITLKLCYHELTWLVKMTLETDKFEDFFRELIDDEDVKKSLERLAMTDESKEIRCAAIRRVDNVKILREIASKSACKQSKNEAERRLLEMYTPKNKNDC